MSLDTAKLENVRHRSGRILAACPACREAGADRTGEHLVILDGGKWGCIANTGDAGKEHRRRIAQLVGVGDAAAEPRPLVSRPLAKPSGKPSLPSLRLPCAEDLQSIARVRGWPALAGIETLVTRGLLFIADVFDDGQTWPAWVVTDHTRANAQARKMDGGQWNGIGAKKAKSLPGTTAARCIGAADIAQRPDVWLVEGTPDLCAAPIVAKRAGLDLDQIAFVCVTGAGNSLHPEDLPHFVGKRVVIAMHNDADHGKGAEAAHRWAAQLYQVGAVEVRGFIFAGNGCKDLAEYLRTSGGENEGFPPPSPSPAKDTKPHRPLFVPLETPFVDGRRYARAPATEWPSRLDLFHESPSGNLRRVHGVLMSFSPGSR